MGWDGIYISLNGTTPRAPLAVLKTGGGAGGEGQRGVWLVKDQTFPGLFSGNLA